MPYERANSAYARTMTKQTGASTEPLNSLGIAKRPEDTRVVVAMSGGVDSSVVAAMLKRDGYDVIGMTLQLYDHGAAVKKRGACCAGQDIGDARRVADRMGFPFYVLNYEEKFRKQVIDPFADAYVGGETPIPCVACNQTVKFTDLLATAKDLDADAMATGHYIVSRETEDGHRALYRPKDVDKDQSYFLFATTREQLDFLRFPLGDRTKAETRALAEELGLGVATKSDSQDICFVPRGNYADIIRNLKPEAANSGDIVHVDGRVLGSHDGIVNFTIGQRRGLGVAAGDPLYVVHLDPATARVIVGPKEALATARIYLRDVNWIGDGELTDIGDAGRDIHVKIRSTRPPAPAHISLVDSAVCVELAEGEDGISPGQACVFYENDSDRTRVLGGGWIVRTERDADQQRALDALLAEGKTRLAEPASA